MIINEQEFKIMCNGDHILWFRACLRRSYDLIVSLRVALDLASSDCRTWDWLRIRWKMSEGNQWLFCWLISACVWHPGGRRPRGPGALRPPRISTLWSLYGEAGQTEQTKLGKTKQAASDAAVSLPDETNKRVSSHAIASRRVVSGGDRTWFGILNPHHFYWFWSEESLGTWLYRLPRWQQGAELSSGIG